VMPMLGYATANRAYPFKDAKTNIRRTIPSLIQRRRYGR
jgi:hypothetical protein